MAVDLTNFIVIADDGRRLKLIEVQAGGGGGAVSSVNAKTGAVTLVAADIGAAPHSTIVGATVQAQLEEIQLEGTAPVGAAGGVLSGTYPNPGFANDMASQAELDAHSADTTDVHGIANTADLVLQASLTTQLAGKADLSGGKVPTAQIPTITAAMVAADVATQAELDAHTGATAGAHAATAISSTATGDVAATTVQAAIAELASEKQATSAKGAASGYASLDASTKVPTAQIPTITAAMVAADVATQAELDAATIRDPIWLPSDNALLAATFDPAVGSFAGTPTAGVVYLCRCPLPVAKTFSTIWYQVFTAGATVANAFCGLYNSSGTLLGKTANQSTAMQGTGALSAALTVEAGQSLTVTPANANDFVYCAFVIGSAGTVPQITRAASSGGNAGMAASNKYRFGTSGTGQTALPATVTTTALGVSGNAWWFGLA